MPAGLMPWPGSGRKVSARNWNQSLFAAADAAVWRGEALGGGGRALIGLVGGDLGRAVQGDEFCRRPMSPALQTNFPGLETGKDRIEARHEGNQDTEFAFPVTLSTQITLEKAADPAEQVIAKPQPVAAICQVHRTQVGVTLQA